MDTYVRTEWPPVDTLEGLLALYSEARQVNPQGPLLPPWVLPPAGDGGLQALEARVALLQTWCDAFVERYSEQDPIDEKVAPTAAQTESVPAPPPSADTEQRTLATARVIERVHACAWLVDKVSWSHLDQFGSFSVSFASWLSDAVDATGHLRTDVW